MPKRFCAICGSDLNDLAPSFGMCLKCYLKEHPLFELPEKFSLKICPECGKYAKKDNWIKSESNELFSIIESSVRRFILKSFLKSNNIEFLITFNEKSFIFSTKDMLKSLTAKIDGILIKDKNISHHEKINILLNYELCRNCLNIKGGTYFISIIQLRVKNENFFDILNNVLKEIQVFVEKLHLKDNRQYITKLEDLKNGVDLYLSTNELMNQIIKFLSSNYHFLLKRTKKLVGRDSQKGRNLYRLKSLIKFLPINKNDIISFENKEYIVEKLSKNKVIIRDKLGNKISKKFTYFFSDKIKIKNKMEED